VKNTAAHTKKLASLIKSVKVDGPPSFPDGADPVAVLIQSLLLWQSTTDKAMQAYDKLVKAVVDFNDLRVTMPAEIVGIAGMRDKLALDRAQRIRAVLRDVYLREHAVSLDRVKQMGKRDARKYVESLEGIMPYAAARVLLLCFDVHAMPVDDQLMEALIDAGATDEESDVPELAAWMARQIKAEQGIEAHLALQHWVESQTGAGRKKTTRKKSTTRKKTTTSKKTSTKKKSTSRKKASAR
jgi:endonuclease III